MIELTHNWDGKNYELGTAYGHIALAVTDEVSTCESLEAFGVKAVRAPGPKMFRSVHHNLFEHIAFIEDPDSYKIELVETNSHSQRDEGDASICAT